MSAITQELEDVPVGELVQHPENPRRGNVAAIRESIEANGWYGVVVAQRSTRRILAGNHRWLAASELGLATVPVMWLDVDDDHARRVLLADNRTNDIAAYDTAALVEMLEGMLAGPGLEGTGYSPDDLDDLLADLDRIRETDEATFTGGYAASEQEVQDHYGQGGRQGLQAEGLREVVLIFAEDEYARFADLVKVAKSASGADSTSAVVLAALEATAATEEDTG